MLFSFSFYHTPLTKDGNKVLCVIMLHHINLLKSGDVSYKNCLALNQSFNLFQLQNAFLHTTFFTSLKF